MEEHRANQEQRAEAEQVPRHRSLAMERAYLRALVGPEFRPVLGMVAITLGVGTFVYSQVEGWGVIDALYFSVVTLATIGYGDQVPVTRIGKIFTILYVFVGVGTLGLFLSTVARASTRGSLREFRKPAGRSNELDPGDRDDSDE